MDSVGSLREQEAAPPALAEWGAVGRQHQSRPDPEVSVNRLPPRVIPVRPFLPDIISSSRWLWIVFNLPDPLMVVNLWSKNEKEKVVEFEKLTVTTHHSKCARCHFNFNYALFLSF